MGVFSGFVGHTAFTLVVLTPRNVITKTKKVKNNLIIGTNGGGVSN